MGYLLVIAGAGVVGIVLTVWACCAVACHFEGDE
jgi:hypothetical protein